MCNVCCVISFFCQGKDVIPSNSTSSVSPVSSDESGNKVVDQPSAMEQSDHHPPTTHYDAGEIFEIVLFALLYISH